MVYGGELGSEGSGSGLFLRYHHNICVQRVKTTTELNPKLPETDFPR